MAIKSLPLLSFWLKPLAHSVSVLWLGSHDVTRVIKWHGRSHISTQTFLPEAKRSKGKTQPLAVQGIIYFRETLNAQNWMGSLSQASSLYHEAIGAEDNYRMNATGLH
jgi:hypothetical protein